MTVFHEEPAFTLIRGDCVEAMRAMPDNSFDSFVTDPPYGIRFMGKAWDGADISKKHSDREKYNADPGTGVRGGHKSAAAAAGSYSLAKLDMLAFQEWTAAWAREAYRVLKPGGHLVSFASTRTYHRMASGVEDAGCEIRDQSAWVFGSGFPKSHNLEGDREGWGTALKPAWEPIVLARKPLEGTIAQNVAKWGTGALNVDGCRIGIEEIVTNEKRPGDSFSSVGGSGMGFTRGTAERRHVGRWPANLCHDGSPEVVEHFPKAPGAQGEVTGEEPSAAAAGSRCFGKMGRTANSVPREDEGSAARFFYCAKGSSTDRDEGLDEQFRLAMPGNAISRAAQINGEEATNGRGSHSGPRRNIHPTVKPTELMRWLARLITPPGGRVLDPFNGSGSTGKACMLEGFHYTGIDLDDEGEYLPIAKARIQYALEHKDRWEQIHAAPAPPADIPGQGLLFA